MAVTDLQEFEGWGELEELRRINRELQAKLFKAKAKTADLVAAAHEGAREAMVLLGNPPKVPAPARDRRQGKPEVALLHLSDWQLGKKTESYSSEIAVKRLETLGRKFVKLVEIERAAHPVRECHIMLGGDLPEGATIFPGQVHEIDSGLFVQIATCISAAEQLIRLALANFERVVMWVVMGNHGRIGKRGELAREDNADGFIAVQLRERLAEYESAGRLAWNGPDRFYQLVRIGNYTALLIHGDQIKSFGGNLPAYGIARKVNGWATGVLPPFRDVYLGHFHQPMVLPMPVGSRRTFMNPSIESDSAYAAEYVAATGSPGQRFNMVDPEHGRVSAERIIWLEDE